MLRFLVAITLIATLSGCGVVNCGFGGSGGVGGGSNGRGGCAAGTRF